MGKTAGLKVGFARANINPPLGIHMTGYFKIRKAEGFLDDVEVCVIAFNYGEKTMAMIAVDNCGVGKDVFARYRKNISEKVGLPIDAILIHSTHTHTGPALRKVGGISAEETKVIEDYISFVEQRMIDVTNFAIKDLKPAKMGYGVGLAPNIAFIRRYRMKDGSVKTNPGVNNPDIVEPIGKVDERVSVLRFDREGATSVVLVNFANHPDTVGGNLISGDWPALTRRYVEKILDNTSCIFFNGAEGDVNHVNVHPKKGDFNDMFNDFDGCSRGYGHTKYMARVVTGGVLQAYDKVKYVEVNDINYLQKVVDIPANVPDPKDMPLAHKYNDLHNQGRDDEIPFKAMMLTTVVSEAARMVRLEHGPESFPFLLTSMSIGSVAILGIPGEPFNAIGRALKVSDEWEFVIPLCYTNSAEGYFPMQDSYDEGGYEARGSNFKAGVGEKIIKYGSELLTELKNK